MNIPDEKHGAVAGYKYWDCRCDRCRTAYREWRKQKRRAAGIPAARKAQLVHGTTGGYTNHKCRCELCRQAQRLSVQAYRMKTNPYRSNQ